MPIKFRCPHCEQFLGISRSKAGLVTDCPTCGRTIRVPELDGKVVPLPKPKLDYADSGLARALNELVNLGATDVLAGADQEASPAPKPLPIVLSPAPVVEAVSLPVPLPPEPMPHFDSGDKTAKPESQTSLTPRGTESLWGPLDELAAIPSTTRKEAAPSPRSPRHLLFVGAVCGLGGLGLGFLLGRLTGGSITTDPPPVVAEQPVVPAVAAAPAEQGGAPVPTVPAAPASDLQRAVEGRITYINADGQSRPDVGARILVLPATREGATRLAVDGFRTAGQAADLRVAQASIRALGGDFALAGADGHYEIHLPAAGKYQLLMVSKYQGRGSGGESDPAGVIILKDWFDKPNLFFGQTLSTLTTVQCDGQTSSIRDHVFPKPE